jgi:Flp pilus assembly protein TadG
MENDREKGAAAVEFVLILPLLLVMLFLIMEFSIVLYDKAVITNASREGARSGVVFSYPPRVSVSAITNTVSSYCASNLISFGLATPATVVSGPCVNTGDPLTVNVSYTYSFYVLPNFISGLGTGITLTGTTVMRCE